jgi:hypothetical protein
MNDDNELLHEMSAMDILSGCMYSLSFSKSITAAIFDPNLRFQKIGDFYDQWKRECGFNEDENQHLPYSLGTITGYLYCGVLLAKEKWIDLLPEDPIEKTNPDWGFSSAVYTSSKNQTPTVKYTFRRIRNALGHGNIIMKAPDTFKRNPRDRNDFEKIITLLFHDENPRDPSDTFDIEISLFGLAKAIRRFQSISYENVISKIKT